MIVRFETTLGSWFCFLLTFVLCLISILFPGEGSTQDSSSKVQAIEISGNQRIESTAIVGRLTLEIGDLVTQTTLKEQIQNIYQMGFFDDVQVQTEPIAQGIKVRFLVKEKPFTVDIVFDGNDHLSDDKLQEVITLRSQVFLDQQQVKISVQKIREAYRKDGYHKSEVIPIVEELGETRDRITFFIQEGTQARIETINFIGANVVKKDALIDVLANREYVPIISWITDAGVFRQEEIPNDVERLKEFYSNRGYLDVQVGRPEVELSEYKESFTLTFHIVEGQPYTVSNIEFKGNTIFEKEELEVDLSIVPGDVFQRTLIRSEVGRITDLYGVKGYSFAEVTPSILPNPENLTTSVTFTIKEGSLIRVREIRISGNDKTRDNVIRRELRVDEQAVIDSVGIKRSFQRLNNLNFFETVEILPQQVEEDKVDLDVKVKEKPTGSFSIGGGFSTLDQFTLIANITEANLFGLGYLVRVRGQLGGRRTIGVLTFRNPALFDGPTFFQADAFSTETDFLTYEQETRGGTLRVGRSLSEYIRGSVTLLAEEITIKNPSSDAGPTIEAQLGDQSTTGFRANIMRDTRDNLIDPRTGLRTGLRVGFGSSVFGGTNDFYSFSLDALKYIPFPFLDLRWATRGRFGIAEGYSGDDVPLTELFFVGGINTVRGFKFGRAGPVTTGGTLLGGTKQIIFNNELIFPILPDAKLSGVLFFDYGEGLAKGQDLTLDLRAGTGLEVRWVSPFGPLRGAWGINLDPRGGEDSTVFEFSVGNVF